MNKEEQKGLYERALTIWGSDAQETMVFEELGELTTALARYKRGRAMVEDVITELADVTIMCEQMAILFGYEKYKDEIERKLERLKKRLDK